MIIFNYPKTESVQIKESETYTAVCKRQITLQLNWLFFKHPLSCENIEILNKKCSCKFSLTRGSQISVSICINFWSGTVSGYTVNKNILNWYDHSLAQFNFIVITTIFHFLMCMCSKTFIFHFKHLSLCLYNLLLNITFASMLIKLLS